MPDALTRAQVLVLNGWTIKHYKVKGHTNLFRAGWYKEGVVKNPRTRETAWRKYRGW